VIGIAERGPWPARSSGCWRAHAPVTAPRDDAGRS